MKTCPFCGTPVTVEGCEPCLAAMIGNWDEHWMIVDAYFKAWYRETMGPLLARHALFGDWLLEHPQLAA